MRKAPKSQLGLLMDYFKDNPNRNIPHAEIVDHVTAEWEKSTGKKFRDPDRGIRTLFERGTLQKIRTGVYRYDPDVVVHKESQDFTAKQKVAIFKKDKYKCVVCGKGKKEGMELHADHIIPRSKGGKATVANGQTLCSQHNIMKANYSQTGFGKKMFLDLRKKAKKAKDPLMLNFANDILDVYKKHGIDKDVK